MPSRILVIVSKIILFYSVFYVVMKGIIIIQGAWLWTNLILASPFILLGASGYYLLKQQKFSWIYALTGVIIISIVRYFEQDWSLIIHSFLS